MSKTHHLQAFITHKFTRIIGLLLLLSLTVLTALWQYTAAESPEIAASGIAATPRPASPSPTPASSSIVLDPAALTVAVNKQRALPTSYTPANLVVPNVPLRANATTMQSHLRADAAAALEQLFAGARAEGLHLALISGYRSAAYQTTVYNSAVRSVGQAAADQAVARPGHSEHQTGLAADIGRTDDACDIAACFGDTAEGRWVAAHAPDYGFIVRYPAGRESLTGYQYEPWHMRYVGPDAARALTTANQILEEYLGLPFASSY
jgi:D-alanyl-D-alanine carboxypeptidase